MLLLAIETKIIKTLRCLINIQYISFAQYKYQSRNLLACIHELKDLHVRASHFILPGFDY